MFWFSFFYCLLFLNMDEQNYRSLRGGMENVPTPIHRNKSCMGQIFSYFVYQCCGVQLYFVLFQISIILSYKIYFSEWARYFVSRHGLSILRRRRLIELYLVYPMWESNPHRVCKNTLLYQVSEQAIIQQINNVFRTPFHMFQTVAISHFQSLGFMLTD